MLSKGGRLRGDGGEERVEVCTWGSVSGGAGRGHLLQRGLRGMLPEEGENAITAHNSQVPDVRDVGVCTR